MQKQKYDYPVTKEEAIKHILELERKFDLTVLIMTNIKRIEKRLEKTRQRR
jgi:hypothetical protein